MAENSEYLTPVVPNMDSLGTSRNNLYYSKDQLKVQSVQNDTIFKFNQSVPSLGFGSSSDITVNNQDFMSDFYLYVKMQIEPNNSLQAGWLFALIGSIQYTWGSSSQSQVSLNSAQIFQICMQSCETSEKRAKMLENAGTLQPTAATQRTVEACLQIPLPWSTNRNSMDKLPYDTSILTSPVIVKIGWAQANEVIGTHAASTIYPSSLLAAQVIIKQVELTNRADSMKNVLTNNDQLLLGYPFYHRQNGSSESFQNVPVGGRLSIKLQSLINADLLGILYYCVPSDDLRSGGAASQPVNRFNTFRVRNVVLESNGQVMYQAPYHVGELIQASIDVGDSETGKSYVDAAGASQSSGVIHGNSATKYFVNYIPLTFSKAINFGDTGEFHNTSRFGNQILTLSFDLENTATTNVTFHSTYIYNAVSMSSGGTTQLQFS